MKIRLTIDAKVKLKQIANLQIPLYHALSTEIYFHVCFVDVVVFDVVAFFHLDKPSKTLSWDTGIQAPVTKSSSTTRKPRVRSASSAPNIRHNGARSLLVFGGIELSRDADQPTGDVIQKYDLTTNQWEAWSSMPEPRHHHAVVTLNDYVYILGIIYILIMHTKICWIIYIILGTGKYRYCILEVKITHQQLKLLDNGGKLLKQWTYLFKCFLFSVVAISSFHSSCVYGNCSSSSLSCNYTL